MYGKERPVIDWSQLNKTPEERALDAEAARAQLLDAIRNKVRERADMVRALEGASPALLTEWESGFVRDLARRAAAPGICGEDIPGEQLAYLTDRQVECLERLHAKIAKPEAGQGAFARLKPKQNPSF